MGGGVITYTQHLHTQRRGAQCTVAHLLPKHKSHNVKLHYLSLDFVAPALRVQRLDRDLDGGARLCHGA